MESLSGWSYFEFIGFWVLFACDFGSDMKSVAARVFDPVFEEFIYLKDACCVGHCDFCGYRLYPIFEYFDFFMLNAETAWMSILPALKGIYLPASISKASAMPTMPASTVKGLLVGYSCSWETMAWDF